MIKVIYISAPWCGPCKLFKPIVTQFFEDHAGQIESIFADAEDELAQQLQVRAVPTIVFLKNDKEQARLTGAQSRKKLELTLDEVMI